MKTIFITISRGSIAKNLLQTDFFKILKDKNLRIVIFSPAYKHPEFIELFGGKNIFFEPLFEHKWQPLDYFFTGLHKALVYNASTELRDNYGIYSKKETNAVRRVLKKIIFKPLSKFNGLREIVKFFDGLLAPDHYYKYAFEKYSPDLAFSTNPLEDSDSFFIKQAKKQNIKIVAMPKSWDNLPKMSLRSKPDKLLVWGDSMVRDALDYQNIKEKNIEKCGVPQFDIYTDQSVIWSRDKFFSYIGADPAKKLLVLGSEGKVTPEDPEIAEILYNFLRDKKIVQPAQLFIRPYFSLLGEENKFTNLINKTDVIIDRWFKRNESFRDHWDYSKDQMIFFVNLLHHMDIMITHASTLMLDAAALNKPIIGIGFDGYKKKSFGESSYRLYFSAHFRPVYETGGAWIVRDRDELISAINTYLVDPTINSGGREKMRNYFCHKIDGMASERVANNLLSALSLP